MQKKGLIEKVDESYTHTIYTCYKCGTTLEPLPLEQWFVKVTPLAQKAIEVVKEGKIKIYPKQFKTRYLQWLENLRDWNISRQIIWGIRIPAWKNTETGKWVVTEGAPPKGENWQQDTDTFDTWFSSGQWPFVTLQTTKPGDFEKFYPTTVMETAYDILPAWVSRMVMLGPYATGQIPFENVLFHGLVNDPYGKKMSKSKGNVVDPLELVDQYGADALRMALVYGTAFGHDQSLSHPKLQAMRNFTNKLWNIGRFIIDFAPNDTQHLDKKLKPLKNTEDQKIKEKLEKVAKIVMASLDSYRFHDAAETLYEFIWHEFADKYLESSKDRRAEAQPILEYVFRTSLELLHPFMPFITEEIWQKLPHEGESITVSKWPEAKITAKLTQI